VALHRLQGTYRKSRHGNTPEPDAAIPKVPPGMDKEARKWWRYYAPRLAKLRVLTEVDRECLAIYCTAAARRERAEIEILKTGAVVKTPAGFAAVNPWLNVSNKAAEIMLRYGQELGMSPASRTRIKVSPSPLPQVPSRDRGFVSQIVG
jgi:P27 family predicted phage terminase small subunit